MVDGQDLSNVASDRLGAMRKMLGIAVLRCHNVPAVPEEFQLEELNGTCLRPFVEIAC